jgi:hypothetical protein
MKAMSVIKIKERRCTRLTGWMGFHAGLVSGRYEQRRCIQLTIWMGFCAGDVSE